MNQNKEGFLFFYSFISSFSSSSVASSHKNYHDRALVELIGNRRSNGTFDGNIYFTGPGSKISVNRASAVLPWVFTILPSSSFSSIKI